MVLPCIHTVSYTHLDVYKRQIKYKKKKGILQKKLPIEGKLAIKNIKRMKNKYRVITILLVVCMTSYITISTYINYEEKTAELVTGYDVDAKLTITSMNIDLSLIHILTIMLAKKGIKVVANYKNSQKQAVELQEQLKKDGIDIDIFKADVSHLSLIHI